MNQLVAMGIRSVPLWLIAIALVLVSLGVCELALKVAQYRESHGKGHGSVSFVITPIFALLAFMLASTFSMGLQRFDSRRMALMSEVEAIGTEFDRASLLDEPGGTAVRQQLRAFAHCRIMPPESEVEAAAARARDCRTIQNRMWEQTRASVQPVRLTALGSYIVFGMNDVLNAATRRDISVRSFIPNTVLTVLILCILAASASLGLAVADTKSRFRPSVILLLSLYGLCFILILDIDGSMKGSIEVSQLPMQELATRLDQASQ